MNPIQVCSIGFQGRIPLKTSLKCPYNGEIPKITKEATKMRPIQPRLDKTPFIDISTNRIIKPVEPPKNTGVIKPLDEVPKNRKNP